MSVHFFQGNHVHVYLRIGTYFTIKQSTTENTLNSIKKVTMLNNCKLRLSNFSRNFSRHCRIALSPVSTWSGYVAKVKYCQISKNFVINRYVTLW